MTTPTISTIAELRRAVCIDPHDDTVRLALADALDEHGGEMERQWAALIRFQIALVGHPVHHKAETGCPHRIRESALLRDLTPWLRRGERCERCKGKGRFTNSTKLGGTHTSGCPTCHGTGWLGSLAEFKREAMTQDGWRWLIPATITRGFVGRVELTVEQVKDAEFLRRLFCEWPVTEVAYTDRIPSWTELLSSQSVVSLGRAAAGLPQIGEG